MKAVAALAFTLLALAPTGAKAEVIDFRGENLATGKLEELKLNPVARATVVVFLSAKCPCSQTHVKHLGEIAREFKDFAFVGFVSNRDEDLKTAREYFAGLALPFPVYRDENAVIANRLGALKTPHAFLLDPKGAVVFDGGVSSSSNGLAADKYHLKLALSQMGEGRRPEPARVRTLGCEIRR